MPKHIHVDLFTLTTEDGEPFAVAETRDADGALTYVATTDTDTGMETWTWTW